MARKATRLLSLLLAMLMIVSMVSVVAIADYAYDEAATNQTYYKAIDYDKLVGKENEGTLLYKWTYVVDDDWNFAKGEEPEEVSFYFRGKTITEKYNPARHLTDVKKMYTQAKADGVSLPYCILTPGNYTAGISLTDSVILLGANAGINPNIPHDDPTAEWELNPNRFLPDMTSTNYGNETRIWAGVDLCETPRVAGNTLKLFQIASSSNVSRTYVVDGLLFQGYGASFYDANAGSGTRTYYVQNCIMNDNSAYDVSPIRLWGRGASTTVSKQMHFSNSYVTGNNAMYFYSGHATKLHINGVSYQNSTQSFIYNVMTMQWIGMDFAMTNCHLWNSEKLATENLATSMYIVRCPYTSTSYAEAGTNSEPFHYNITNNTICNMTALNKDGTLRSSTTPFLFYMASSNEMIKFEDNIVTTTMAMKDGEKCVPITINYNKLADGTISRASNEKVSTTATANYHLGAHNISIKNNILTKGYWSPINIGTNTCPDTLIEYEGNLYAEKYDAENPMTGTVLENDSKNNYDKWVWLEYDPKGANDDASKKSSYVNEGAVQITATDLVADPADPHKLSVDVTSDTATLDLSMICDTTINSVDISKADAAFNKGDAVAMTGNTVALSTEERQNYYVLSVYSVDKRTSVDYELTVNRAIKSGAVLSGLVDEASKTEVQDKTVDYFNYEVNYAEKTFDFTLDVPEGATATLTDAAGATVEPVGANTYSIPLDEVAKKYEYDVVVTNTDGSEKFELSLLRKLNERTALTKVTPTIGTASLAGTTWTLALNNDDMETAFSVELSEFASVEILDPVYNAPLNAVNGVYTLRNIAVGANAYTAKVKAQNGVDEQEWTLIVNRPARTDATLYSINNANLEGGVYYANTTGNRYMVGANYPASATLGVYADEACTRKITNMNLTLTALTTNVWVKVTAEDGVTNTVTKLVIKTTSLSTEPGVVYQPMNNDGVISVSGAAFNGNKITVTLPDDSKKFNFVALGLNGYRVRIYADDTMTLLTSAEQIINLDAGTTKLYAQALKGGETKDYVIEIIAKQFYTFKDKTADWAKPYVEAMGTSGIAIMKGNDLGKFNGEDKLTRYEMAVMMVRMLGIDKDLYSKLSLNIMDADQVPAWAADYLKVAYRLGLVGGYAVTDAEEAVVGYEFRGDKQATRAELFRIFTNAVTGDVDAYYEKNKTAIDKKVNKANLADAKAIPDWAISAVYTAVYMDIVKGNAQKMINPDDLITRNEVATLLARYLLKMK